MPKKHWIYIKRGLSEDPKHRANMGECVWLFMHIIDRSDWETGIAYDWKDTLEAVDMGIPVDTLRRQRQKLSELGYITCEQKQHSQNITILEWRNPRDYGSEVINPKNKGSHETPPSKNEGLNQGLNEGLNQVPLQMPTPSYSSKSKSSSVGKTAEIFTAFENNICMLTPILAEKIGDAIDTYPHQWILDAIGESVTYGARNWKYIEKILKTWKEKGRSDNKPIDKLNDVDQELLRRGIKPASEIITEMGLDNSTDEEQKIKNQKYLERKRNETSDQ